MSQSKHNHA